ncbi:MAG: hypothetical protein IPP90_11480 [Gemmatimonadaceae bacterium]|nr:hypothetical protein [Gemmatimonadaceae bacterium]
MIDGDIIAGALELIGHAFESLSDKPNPRQFDDSDQSPLTPRERELAAAIRDRRKVSAKTAEDLVRWLRTRNP